MRVQKYAGVAFFSLPGTARTVLRKNGGLDINISNIIKMPVQREPAMGTLI